MRSAKPAVRDHGLGCRITCSTATSDFNLGRSFSTLTARLGVLDSSKSGGSAHIQILADGNVIVSPWTISVIGDPNRLAQVADLMIQQLRADRRVRGASYRVETDVVISSLISEKPFVYALPG